MKIYLICLAFICAPVIALAQYPVPAGQDAKPPVGPGTYEAMHPAEFLSAEGTYIKNLAAEMVYTFRMKNVARFTDYMRPEMEFTFCDKEGHVLKTEKQVLEIKVKAGNTSPEYKLKWEVPWNATVLRVKILNAQSKRVKNK
jgi:hypothetical protein